MQSLLKSIISLDADHRLWIALSAGTLAYFLAGAQMLGQTRWVVAYVVYAVVSIGLTWTIIIISTPQETQKTNRLEDSSRILILAFIVAAAFASLFAVIVLVKWVKAVPGASTEEHILVSLLTVIFSWILVHTVFTFRYAHLYYGNADKPVGGLDFPGDDAPDYLDFAYFSFGVGMTSQVSDVDVTASGMRRLVLLHSILAFAFNAVIIALTINIISGLIGQ